MAGVRPTDSVRRWIPESVKLVVVPAALHSMARTVLTLLLLLLAAAAAGDASADEAPSGDPERQGVRRLAADSTQPTTLTSPPACP